MCHEVVHHHTVPELGVVAGESRVRSYFDPIVIYHVPQRFIACKGGQTSLSCVVLGLAEFHILHPVSFKCEVLFFDLGELAVNLPNKPFSFQGLEWIVVEPKATKILLYPPWILVRGWSLSSKFVWNIAIWLVNQPSGQHPRNQIRDLVDSLGTLEVITAHEFQNCDEFVWTEVIEVEFRIQFFNDIKEIFFELVIMGKRFFTFRETSEHCQKPL